MALCVDVFECVDGAYFILCSICLCLFVCVYACSVFFLTEIVLPFTSMLNDQSVKVYLIGKWKKNPEKV